MNDAAPDSALVSAFVPSPNHGERVEGARIDSIILHYTGLREDALAAWTCDPGGEALRWMCNPNAQVSSHYLVETDGRIIQLVPEVRRAWHAGRSFWKGCSDLNSCSIGIEIANAGHAGGLPPYPDAQILAVIELCRNIVPRHNIPADRILAHSDIAPYRKADPGEHFPWRRLHEAGVGFLVEPAAIIEGGMLAQGSGGEAVRSLQEKLATVGYGISLTGLFDQETERVVRAFQRRFRPERVDGNADASTLATLDKVLAALSVAN